MLGYAKLSRDDADDYAAPVEATVEATVEANGLHPRYRLARRETIESRPEPTTVLVGRRKLDVAIERYAVPAINEFVWVRGRTLNNTGWTLLPGPLSIYVGDEYLGRSRMERVARILLVDNLEQPGFFGSDLERTESWVVRLANSGRLDAQVLPFEALPRVRDERIDVIG